MRDERHRSFLQGLGAHQVVVDPGDGFHKHPAVGRVEIALDTVGAATFNAALRGRCAWAAASSSSATSPRRRSQVNLGYVITHGLTVRGGSGATRRDMAELFALHEAAPFRVAINRDAPALARADEAQRLVRAGGLAGRVVLVPDGA